MVDAGPDHEPPTSRATTMWTINWSGVVVLLLIVAIGLIAWRWLAGTSVFSDDDDSPGDSDVSVTSIPARAGDEIAAVPAPQRSTTTTGPARPTVSSPTTPASERRVLISGEMKPCRFGSDCLVASFTIDGFDEHPGRFVCIYPNSRSDFGFGAGGVDDACITADEGDTITIEIDGVRSATISEQDLDGTQTVEP